MPPVAEVEAHVEMTPVGQAVISTQTDQDTHVSRRSSAKSWQCSIDLLQKWWNDPEYFDDENFDPPAREVIAMAMKFAADVRTSQTPPPDRVVPDGDGGIVFEISKGTLSEKIHFWDDGDVEYLLLSESKVVKRRTLPQA